MLLQLLLLLYIKEQMRFALDVVHLYIEHFVFLYITYDKSVRIHPNLNINI